MAKTLDELAVEYHCRVQRDDYFQRILRLQESIWREEQGYSCGIHNGKPLGSILPMPWAKETLANYLTDTIRNVVRVEVLDGSRSHNRMYGKPRILGAFHMSAEVT